MTTILEALKDANWPERFLKRVAVGGADECWTWRGAFYRTGYAMFSWQGRNQRAHRLAWEWSNGREIPAGLFCCHRCDNRACVNPAHLWIGTNSDNMRDCASKGRIWLQSNPLATCLRRPGSPRAFGEAHGMVKLRDSDVLELRRLAEQGVPDRELAQRFSIHVTHAGKIRRGVMRSRALAKLQAPLP